MSLVIQRPTNEDLDRFYKFVRNSNFSINNPFEDKNEYLIKKLKQLLRHHATKRGINVQTDGYMNIRAVRCVLNEMVSTDAKHAKVEAIKISLNDIATCVENDNKNHFQISDDGNKIRATFAHSISTVDYKKVFEEITDENMTCVYSITDKQNHMTIERKGIDLPPNKQYFFCQKLLEKNVWLIFL